MFQSKESVKEFRLVLFRNYVTLPASRASRYRVAGCVQAETVAPFGTTRSPSTAWTSCKQLQTNKLCNLCITANVYVIPTFLSQYECNKIRKSKINCVVNLQQKNIKFIPSHV